VPFGSGTAVGRIAAAPRLNRECRLRESRVAMQVGLLRAVAVMLESQGIPHSVRQARFWFFGRNILIQNDNLPKLWNAFRLFGQLI